MGAIWTYYHRTKVVFGAGSLDLLPKETEPFQAKRVLLVTGASSMRKSGVLDRVLDMLGRERVVLFDRVPPNPPYSSIDEGAALADAEGCGLVVALGGGSAMDVGKAIAMLAAAGGAMLDYLNRDKEFTKPGIPFIAIPTTAGTGSEVNPNVVATDPARDLKLALAPIPAYPKTAILDPALTLTLPKNQTAATGLDALSHAFESYWNKNSQPVSELNAIEAIKLIFKWLPAAVGNGNDLEAHEKMLYASMIASFAFGSTGTAACHAISYPLTVKWGLDHGFACAFTLPEMLARNWDALGAEKRQNLLDAMCAENGDGAVRKLREFCALHGAPATLEEIGVKSGDLDSIESCIPQRIIGNTLVPPEWKDILEMLKKGK